MNTVFNF